MVATSTAINGCDAQLLAAGPDGTMYDISGSSSEFTLDLNKDVGDYKVFGNKWKFRLDCGKDATLTLNVVYTKTNNEGFDLLRDWYFNGSGARRFILRLPDGSVGSDEYDGYYVLESMSIPSPADEPAPIIVSATLLPNGPILYSVVSTT